MGRKMAPSGGRRDPKRCMRMSRSTESKAARTSTNPRTLRPRWYHSCSEIRCSEVECPERKPPWQLLSFPIPTHPRLSCRSLSVAWSFVTRHLSTSFSNKRRRIGVRLIGLVLSIVLVEPFCLGTGLVMLKRHSVGVSPQSMHQRNSFEIEPSIGWGNVPSSQTMGLSSAMLIES